MTCNKPFAGPPSVDPDPILANASTGLTNGKKKRNKKKSIKLLQTGLRPQSDDPSTERNLEPSSVVTKQLVTTSFDSVAKTGKQHRKKKRNATIKQTNQLVSRGKGDAQLNLDPPSSAKTNPDSRKDLKENKRKGLNRRHREEAESLTVQETRKPTLPLMKKQNGSKHVGGYGASPPGKSTVANKGRSVKLHRSEGGGKPQVSHNKKGLRSFRKTFSFLHLPQELRDMIYRYTLNFDGLDRALESINQQCLALPANTSPKRISRLITTLTQRNPRKTPSVLLVNCQIYHEAKEVLEKETLQLTHPPLVAIPGVFGILNFITDETIENLRNVHLRLHTYSVDKGSKSDLLGPDWRGVLVLKGEALAESHAWALLLLDCVRIWWKSKQLRSLILSIDYLSSSNVEYSLPTSQSMLLALEQCVQNCLKSHNLDLFTGFLTYANIPSEGT